MDAEYEVTFDDPETGIARFAEAVGIDAARACARTLLEVDDVKADVLVLDARGEIVERWYSDSAGRLSVVAVGVLAAWRSA